MNRAERRRLDKQTAKEPTITMTRSELNRIKMDIANKAAQQVFTLMLAIPAFIIHRNFGDLVRRETDGISREARFVEMCLEMYERVEMGVIKLEAIRDQFERETGIKIKPREDSE